MRVMFWSAVFWPSIGGVQTMASDLLVPCGSAAMSSCDHRAWSLTASRGQVRRILSIDSVRGGPEDVVG